MGYGYSDMLKTPPEVKLATLIIKEMASGKDEEIKDLLNLHPINWARLKDIIIYHELTPFAYLSLKDLNSILPPDLYKFLKNNYYSTIIGCQYLWQEFLRISMVFKQAGITLLPIKGIALLEDIYTQKPFRPMVDIDLLAKEKDLDKAAEILCNLGYRKELCGVKEEYWRRSQCHIPFYKKGGKFLLSVELHWGLDFKRRGRSLLLELWERIREVDLDGRKIKLLSPEDTLFSLALHNRRYGKTLCLKSIYDLALLLNKYAAQFDWDYVLCQSREYNICSAVFFALYQAKFVSCLNLAEDVWKGLKIPRWKKRIIRRFIEKNTFSPGRNSELKNLYLKSHFLLYDSLWEPVDYILNIPKEQFARFYGLKPYDKKTDFFYRRRFFYIFFKSVSNLLRSFFNTKKNGIW